MAWLVVDSSSRPVSPESGVDEASAAPVKGSIALVASLTAADNFLDDLSSDDLQLLILVLANSTQPGHRLARSDTRPTHHNADRPVDHAAGLQRRLQLRSQPLNLR
jgi:hypothetical protein